MRPLIEGAKKPFVKPPDPEKNSNQPALQLIADTLQKRYGATYAQCWLEKQQGRLSPLPELQKASDLLDPSKIDPQDGFETRLEALRSPETEFLARWTGNTAPPQSPKPLKRFSASELAKERLSRLEHPLPATSRRLYAILLELALTLAHRRGYAEAVGSLTFFCPLEIVAFALGVHRTTIWRNLEPLQDAGLVDARDFVTTVEHSPSLRSNNLVAGKLWNIKLDPSTPTPAKLHHDDFKAQWRDLDRDIQQGKTAHNFILEAKKNPVEKVVQQSNTEKDTKRIIEILLDWSLSPLDKQTPLSMTVAPDSGQNQRFDLETVLDLPATPKPQRNQMIDIAATAICKNLGDIHSLGFYRRTLWNLLRQYDMGNDWFIPFYEMLLRARTDYKEGFARKAGALLHSRLKEWTAWDELQRTPPFRVGKRPVRG